MLDNEFDFMQLIIQARTLKKLTKMVHNKQINKGARESVKIKSLVQVDDAKKVIKIDSDEESEVSSVAAFSPRTNPLSDRDILSDDE